MIEGITALVIVALIIGYLNLWLIIKKEKPTIIINNTFSKEITKSEKASDAVEIRHNIEEVPIENISHIKNIEGTVRLNSDKLVNSDVTKIINKIKNYKVKQ